jgi:hypothetical protein
MLKSRLTFANVISVIALVFALGGSSAYAANTVFSADIVDGEVKTADLGPDAVTNAKLADNAVGTHKINDGGVRAADIDQGAVTSAHVADDSLTGADIDESTLDLPPTTAGVISNRLVAPIYTSCQTVLSLPSGLGELRVRTCNGKSTGTMLVNNTIGYLDVAVDGHTAAGTSFDVFRLAPGESASTNVEGYERAIYQVGLGLPGKVATVTTTGWDPNKGFCKFQAMAVVK